MLGNRCGPAAVFRQEQSVLQRWKMTIKEISEKLGLSKSTVSICLAGRESDPRFCIKPEKARMVREFARKNGYVPNLAARRLRSRSMEPPVGLLFNRKTGIEKSLPSLREAMDILEQHDREYVTMGYKERKMSDSLALLKSMNVRNVIIFGTLFEPCPIHHTDAELIRDAESKRMVNEWYRDWAVCRELGKDLTLYATDYRFPAPADGGATCGRGRNSVIIQGFPEYSEKTFSIRSYYMC